MKLCILPVGPPLSENKPRLFTLEDPDGNRLGQPCLPPSALAHRVVATLASSLFLEQTELMLG